MPSEAGNWLSVALSILAFLVSFIALYRSGLSPFEPMIALGKPTWRLERYRGGPNLLLRIDIPLVLINLGARAGIVDDMLLKLRGPNRTWELIPTFLLEGWWRAKRYMSLEELARSGVPTFRPVTLTAHQQVERDVLFLPNSEDEAVFQPGLYRITLAFKAVEVAPPPLGVMLIETLARCLRIVERPVAVKIIPGGWREQEVGSYRLTDEDISAMRQGNS
jgi:hypothetical protein